MSSSVQIQHQNAPKSTFSLLFLTKRRQNFEKQGALRPPSIYAPDLNTKMRQHQFPTQTKRHDVYLFLSVNGFIVSFRAQHRKRKDDAKFNITFI